MITLKRKESYSGALPRYQTTPTMEEKSKQFAAETNMGQSEIQRRAMDLFLLLVCQNWQTEYPETQGLLDAYVESTKKVNPPSADRSADGGYIEAALS